MAKRRRKAVVAELVEVVQVEEELDEEEPEEEDIGGQSSEDRIIAGYKARISNPLTAIRAMCIECMGGGVQLVSDCISINCSLHPFRMGKNTMHGRFGKPNENAKKVMQERYSKVNGDAKKKKS